MLAAAAAAAGEWLDSLAITQVRYRPGRSVTASYRARLGSGPALLVAHAGDGMPAGAVLLDDGEVRVGVWRFPNDPALPGLRHAVDGQLLPRLLDRLGIPGGVAGVRRRAYRPTRRAVVEIATDRGPLFLKVVRPDRAPGLRARHDAIAAAVESPRVVGADPDIGVLVLSAVDGVPLRDALRAEPPPRLPGAAGLEALLDCLPLLPRRTAGPLERVGDHTELLAAVAPGLARELAELATALPPDPAREAVPVHGDFHPGQVMVRDGAAAGLVDVDAAGMGARADDLATLLAYLAAEQAAPAAAYGAELTEGFSRRPDPPRVAAALLGFATMPFVTQRPDWPALVRRRVERAQAWLAGGGETQV